MVKASIIIPAFNASRFIAATLASACAQTERDLEVLVIDDCSTDDTADRVRTAALADPRIQLLKTERNGGPSAARNLGLDNARGEWIALLDADDSMAPERLAALMELGLAQAADIVSDNILLVDETGRTPPAPMIPADLLRHAQQLSLAEFIARNVGSPKYPRVSYGFMKPIIRRALLNAHAIRYDEQVRFAEDFALYVRCLSAGAVWWVTPKPLYRYLVRENSLTEVQTSGDLDRLRHRQRALLSDPKVKSDPALVKAITQHLAVIDRNYFYRAFTDAIKARRLGSAVTLIAKSPASLRFIAAESFRQFPIILAKALRGGYGRRRSTITP